MKSHKQTKIEFNGQVLYERTPLPEYIGASERFAAAQEARRQEALRTKHFTGKTDEDTNGEQIRWHDNDALQRSKAFIARLQADIDKAERKPARRKPVKRPGWIEGGVSTRGW